MKAMDLFPEKDAKMIKVLHILSGFHVSSESFTMYALDQCYLKELTVMKIAH